MIQKRYYLQCNGYDYLSKWKNGVEKGCQIEGHLSISKVQGHVYIVPSRLYDHLSLSQLREVYPYNRGFFDFLYRTMQTLNVTHTIHSFSFGEDIIVCIKLNCSLQNQESPFRERVGVMTTEHSSMYQYFVNAIPTTYTDSKGKVTKTYQ